MDQNTANFMPFVTLDAQMRKDEQDAKDRRFDASLTVNSYFFAINPTRKFDNDDSTGFTSEHRVHNGVPAVPQECIRPLAKDLRGALYSVEFTSWTEDGEEPYTVFTRLFTTAASAHKFAAFLRDHYHLTLPVPHVPHWTERRVEWSEVPYEGSDDEKPMDGEVTYCCKYLDPRTNMTEGLPFWFIHITAVPVFS